MLGWIRVYDCCRETVTRNRCSRPSETWKDRPGSHSSSRLDGELSFERGDISLRRERLA